MQSIDRPVRATFAVEGPIPRDVHRRCRAYLTYDDSNPDVTMAITYVVPPGMHAEVVSALHRFLEPVRMWPPVQAVHPLAQLERAVQVKR